MPYSVHEAASQIISRFLMDESQKSPQAVFNFKKFHEPEHFNDLI